MSDQVVRSWRDNGRKRAYWEVILQAQNGESAASTSSFSSRDVRGDVRPTGLSFTMRDRDRSGDGLCRRPACMALILLCMNILLVDVLMNDVYFPLIARPTVRPAI